MALYDSQGVLRCTGRDHADCLAYAELFGLEPGGYSITSLGALTSLVAASSECAAA